MHPDPSKIAKLLTEDPDIFMELDDTLDSQPVDTHLTPAEMETQAAEELPDEAEPEDIDKRVIEKDIEQQELEKRRDLAPQLGDMQKILGNVRAGSNQDFRNASQLEQNRDDLDREISSLDVALRQLGREMQTF